MQILAEALPQGIRIPSLAEYDGTGDPEDHLEKFLAKQDLLDMSDAGYCKFFRTTLSGKAMAWFNQLLIHTIENFEQLSQQFLHHFSINKRYPKTASYLFTIIQQEHEDLRDYVQRFSEAVLEVPHLNHELLASILRQGLRRGRFRESIAGKPPTTLDELLKRAAKYIRIEEALKPKEEVNNKRKNREGERKDPRREGLAEGQRHMPPGGFTKYTPLKVPRAEILMAAEQQGIVQWPRKMKDNPKRLKSDRYCRFHKDRGHSTEDCYHLKNEIEKLIQRGYLKEYVENRPSRHASAPRREEGGREEPESSRRKEKGRENLPTAGVISVVIGGPAGADSARARKALIRAASSKINNCKEVTIARMPEEEITFSPSDLERGVPPHNDALVISTTVSNFWVKKVLLTSCSSPLSPKWE
ncbi:UNVERIFIED_CONTAM: hypothetical protein Sradi_0170200 [Sesamum radiatum]|uniref:Retrotransposon gag domain-containing protein n=1 Tax=Sesamum radiatum TaxID=300843 RepID=A0AAW2VZG6_SESRA